MGHSRAAEQSPELGIAGSGEASLGSQVLETAARPGASEQGRKLTPREIEILKVLATGMANKQIARQLGISDKTVRNHLSNLYNKLGIYDRVQAALFAVREGLVKL